MSSPLLDADILLILLAGVGAGIGLTLVVSLSRDFPWMVRILYRFLRYRERPSKFELPPSVKPYRDAILSSLRHAERT